MPWYEFRFYKNVVRITWGFLSKVSTLFDFCFKKSCLLLSKRVQSRKKKKKRLVRKLLPFEIINQRMQLPCLQFLNSDKRWYYHRQLWRGWEVIEYSLEKDPNGSEVGNEGKRGPKANALSLVLNTWMTANAINWSAEDRETFFF